MKPFVIFISIAGLLSVGVAGAISAVTAAPKPVAPVSVQAATARTETFVIRNMTCALCPVTVRKAMEGVQGVRSVAVDFQAKTATVRFDPLKATAGMIAAASANAGYPATLKR